MDLFTIQTGNFSRAIVQLQNNKLARFEEQTFLSILQQMSAPSNAGFLYISGSMLENILLNLTKLKILIVCICNSLF